MALECCRHARHRAWRRVNLGARSNRNSICRRASACGRRLSAGTEVPALRPSLPATAAERTPRVGAEGVCGAGTLVPADSVRPRHGPLQTSRYNDPRIMSIVLPYLLCPLEVSCPRRMAGTIAGGACLGRSPGRSDEDSPPLLAQSGARPRAGRAGAVAAWSGRRLCHQSSS